MSDKRLYPIVEDYFNAHIKPLIERFYSKAGRPSKISDYTVFCAMLYVLRTGIPWRDLPKSYGNWHSIYLRFKRSSDRGVWWQVLLHLQQERKCTIPVVIIDSSTFKVHRHGGGLKGGPKVREEAFQG